jgi:hypothetical protein
MSKSMVIYSENLILSNTCKRVWPRIEYSENALKIYSIEFFRYKIVRIAVLRKLTIIIWNDVLSLAYSFTVYTYIMNILYSIELYYYIVIINISYQRCPTYVLIYMSWVWNKKFKFWRNDNNNNNNIIV